MSTNACKLRHVIKSISTGNVNGYFQDIHHVGVQDVQDVPLPALVEKQSGNMSTEEA